jgi:hypothetical protein
MKERSTRLYRAEELLSPMRVAKFAPL